MDYNPANAGGALVVDVSGSPRQRGQQQGEALRDLIAAHLEAWHGAIALAGFADPHNHVDRFLYETKFAAAIRRDAPQILEEVEGIAEGARLPARQIFALQLLDEEWVYRARQRRAALDRDKCSSVALARRGGPTIVGQNMDLGSYTDGFQVVVRHRSDGARPAQLIFTTAGLVGLVGVNGAGVGVCLNAVAQLPSQDQGVPVAFVMRLVLEARSTAAAVAVIKSLPHASSQHYLIADPDEIVALEFWSGGHARVGAAGDDRIFHTNHPLAHQVPEWRDDGPTSSVQRLQSLQQRLGRGAKDLADVQAALSSFDDPDFPVCRLKPAEAGLINYTTGSIVSLLRNGAEPECYIAFGPPSERGYIRVPMPG